MSATPTPDLFTTAAQSTDPIVVAAFVVLGVGMVLALIITFNGVGQFIERITKK